MGFMLGLLGDQAFADAQKSMKADFLVGKDAGSSPTPTPTPKESQFKNKNQNRSKSIIDERRLDSEALKQSAQTISSLSLLLRKLPPGPSRNQMLTNHAAALNLYAKQILLMSKSNTLSDEIKRYLNAAIKDADEVLKSPVKTNEETWKAYDMKGSAYLYLDQTPEAMASFYEVLKLNPPKDRAGRIGLLIAEDLFERGKFQDAATYYQTYYSKMTPEWQELAYYKLGWCMINLEKISLAEQYLARVARSNSRSGVGKDAMRDLAYLVTHQPDVMGSIKHAEMDLIIPSERANFLAEVRPNLEASGLAAQHGIIVERLLTLEKNPEKRLDYLIANLRVQRKIYASRAHMEAFKRVSDGLGKLNPKSFLTVFPKFEAEIENETQSIMKSYIDSFAGRVKLNEALTQADLASALKTQFSFYHRYFNKKKNHPSIIALWTDVCLEVKDWSCVDQVSDIIIADQDKKLSHLGERAYLDQIAAIEIFIKQSGKGPESKKWVEKKSKRLPDFLKKYPDSKQWVSAAELYTQNEMDLNREKNALPILMEIMNRAPSEDHFYRLQYARFKLNEFESVLGDKRGESYISSGSKVIELHRESALQLAMKAKSKKDLEQYRSYLNTFIGYCRDLGKVSIARVDFFRYLISEKLYAEVAEGLEKLSKEESQLPVYEPIRVELWTTLVDGANYELASSFAKTIQEARPSHEWQQRKFLSKVFQGGNFTNQEISDLKPSEREYFLGLFALSSPQTVIGYAQTNRKLLTDSERTIAGLAIRIANDRRQLVRTPELEQLLGKNYPFSEKIQDSPLAIETQMNAVKFPALEKLSTEKQAKVMQTNIESVQSIRGQILKTIKGKPQEIRLRVLDRARQLESQVADFILSSPIPKELTPEQVKEYQTGLKSAADEFLQQSKEFETLVKGIQEEMGKTSAALEARVLPSPDMSDWPWPNVYRQKLEAVHKQIESGNQLGALGLLDYYRPTLVKEDGDFFFIRAGILLYLNPNAALKVYVLDELEKSSQKPVIDAWRKMVKADLKENQ
jgi:TolA-binding protein